MRCFPFRHRWSDFEAIGLKVVIQECSRCPKTRIRLRPIKESR